MKVFTTEEVIKLCDVAPSIIRVLLHGVPVQREGKIYQLDSMGRLAQVVEDDKGKNHYLIVDFGEGISLMSFLQWCLGFTEDELAINVANLALNIIKQNQ